LNWLRDGGQRKGKKKEKKKRKKKKKEKKGVCWSASSHWFASGASIAFWNYAGLFVGAVNLLNPPMPVREAHLHRTSVKS